MNAITHRQFPSIAEDAAMARDSRQALSRHLDGLKSLKLSIIGNNQAETIKLPTSVGALLMDILEAIAVGKGIAVIPKNTELTTVQAADVLNVSRPFLIKLLEEKKIPYRMVGKHRRIRMEDVMAYKGAIDQEREVVLDQLIADAQDQEMGYDV